MYIINSYMNYYYVHADNLCYSLRPILLFANIDISRHILVVDISVLGKSNILAKSNMGRRKYIILVRYTGLNDFATNFCSCQYFTAKSLGHEQDIYCQKGTNSGIIGIKNITNIFNKPVATHGHIY
jgi:hypothetical protein